MDETQSSRMSDAAATRKRRSSILKNQRAPRTPFSELEFNVATPTDSGKSRRVSFSRRMGVAEFVTNEATTTWKNFYEEHNKSLESSGNESAANAGRPSVSHIGKRLFDQQFEEVEAVDFGSALLPSKNRADFSLSINNINLTQQLAAFDCTVDDKKLVAPQQQFELSSLTEHKSKVFSDDFTIPVMGEMSNQINVDFSVTGNPVGNSNDKCDDLDEIQKDLERSHNVVCPEPFSEGGHMSEYIEVDLNMTHVAVRNDESDMSITDTVYSPKVQEVSSSISVSKSRKPVVDLDWTTDKENIAVLNPYAKPRESDNFAINEMPDQVLVFDGKKLRVHAEQKEISVAANEFKRDKDSYRQTLLPDALLTKTPKRKTVVLNINDDLPNFIEKPILPHQQDCVGGSAQELKHTMIFDERDLSITQAIPNMVQPLDIVESSSKQKMIDYENMTGNISITRAVPTNVIFENNATSEKRKTIIFSNDYGNISTTRAICGNILLDNKCELPNKRRTIVYDDENISFTQAVQANVIMPENRENLSNRTILFQNNIDDISFTQALPNYLHLKNSQNYKTTVFEKSIDNISMTQVLPSNIILFDNDPCSNKRKTIVYENDDGNISMTQAIPGNLFITGKSEEDVATGNKRKTILFENDTGNVSFTQVIPANIIQQEISNKHGLDIRPHEIVAKCSFGDLRNDQNLTVTEASVGISDYRYKSKPNKSLTIMYDERADISMTQALPTNILSVKELPQLNQISSVVIEKETINLAITQAVPNNILLKQECDEKFIMDQNVDNVSISQVVSNSTNLTLKNLVVDNNNCKPNNTLFTNLKHNISTSTKQVIDFKENTINSEIGNLSMTKPIPNKIFEIENEILKDKTLDKFTNLTQFGEKTLLQDTIHDKTNVDVLIYQAETKTNGTLETQISKMDHAVLQDEESNSNEKIDSTSDKSMKRLRTTSNDSEIMSEKDFEMQVNLQNEELTKESNLPTTGNVQVIETVNVKISHDAKENKSILHELLDMSVDDVADKNVMVKFDIELGNKKSRDSSENNSNDNIFIITKDTDEKQLADDSVRKKVSTVKMCDENKSEDVDKSPVLTLQYNKDQENNLEDKLIGLKHSVVDEEKKGRPHNRYYEKIKSPDLLTSFKKDDKSDVQDIKTRKSFKEADDTKELLEILSDFTDRKSSAPCQEDNTNDVSKIKLRRSLALEHKPEMPDPRRLSFAPKRQSIVLSREELLNNLSMAQAILQQTHFDDSEMEDTATESPTELNESLSSPKQSVRISNEVVKTLHFEDESCSDVSLKSDVKISPLKKTAFGETSYMKESKVNVIPTYLKDISENIKALMNDLVKPSPDHMPFEVALPSQKKPSTCSTQIQANLITSSQIDLDVELQSNVNSGYEINKAGSLVTDIADMGNKAINRSLKKPTNAVINAPKMDVNIESYALNSHKRKSSLKKSHQEPVLVFDHRNPLNNVLLAPPNCVDVHKYNPVKSSSSLCAEENLNNPTKVGETNKGNQCIVERVITQYNAESHVGLQSGDACSDKKDNSHTLFSDPSKPLSMDRSTEGFATEVKNTEVNTVIVMKGNKELLEASSSLTLVDDALGHSVFDVRMESRKNDQNSPVKVIYKIEDEDVSMLEIPDLGSVSNDDESVEYTNTRKRSYSPTRRSKTLPTTLSSPDVTPKPISKMQRISNSPNVYNKTADFRRASTEKSEKTDSNSDETESHKKRSSRKSKGNPKHVKPSTDLAVQQLMTEFKITKMEQDMIEDQIIEAIQDRMSLSGTGIDIHKIGAQSPDALSSCTSSKDQNEMQEACVKETSSYVGSQPSKVDWQPDLKELSSKNILTECDSSVNVVAKIDMLPFMGRSGECEWEERASGGDTWVFRLLRARLRLRVRLAHRHHNALRTRVRADTPVEEVVVDAVPVEEKDPLAALCVRFAGEAMRYECSRGCARAGDVPRALRRCAGVARVAMRWARAMRDARTRLAYTLTEDGLLTLKVANIPLRSVWEVSLRLELVVEDAREAAWPRAGELRVRSVLSDCAVPAAEADRAVQALAHDWGHAPRTVWKIFRFLKNKTSNDDFLALGP